MLKIRDRMILGMIAGLGGNVVKTFSDELLLRKKLSKRSFRATAAGVWVNKEKEATNIDGQLLGALFDFGMGALGGIGITYMLSKAGRDYILPKGILSGIAIGSTITALLSVFPQNKVKPKDAASNLAYMFVMLSMVLLQLLLWPKWATLHCLMQNLSMTICSRQNRQQSRQALYIKAGS